MTQYETIIGLETHIQLNTESKIFCSCKADSWGDPPNTNICPICTGQPGAKPMLPNKEAVEKVLAIALMLGCKVNDSLVFQRKHYDWPDLPKGYQDTQSGAYSVPLAENGIFEGIRIRELHVEEDPAAWNPETGAIDYNRSGLPLVEIVTEPDFRSAEQVEEWLKTLILTLSYIKALDKNAGIKADVNVSVGRGERVEIKNLSQKIQCDKNLIISTKLHKPITNTFDALLLLDLDLMILGTTNEEYSAYAEKIRQEYKFVPLFLYRKKRKEVLQKFLNTKRIYLTDYFFKNFEEKARENIQHEIKKKLFLLSKNKSICLYKSGSPIVEGIIS